MENVSLAYWNFDKEEKETAFGYFLIRLLQKNGLWEEENKEVHIYIAGLLLKLIHPTHLFESQKYLVQYETDMTQWLEQSNDRAEQYHCLKFNADHLLIDSGIFLKNEGTKLPEATYRGKAYYRLTSSYAQHIYRKSNTLTHIFDHLSNYFEDYQARLKAIRRSYFQFVNRLTEEEKKDLYTELNQLIQPS